MTHDKIDITNGWSDGPAITLHERHGGRLPEWTIFATTRRYEPSGETVYKTSPTWLTAAAVLDIAHLVAEGWVVSAQASNSGRIDVWIRSRVHELAQ